MRSCASSPAAPPRRSHTRRLRAATPRRPPRRVSSTSGADRMSIASILSTAKSGLLASQRAVEITSNNVANAGTAGYTRQRVEQEEALPTRFTYGEFGNGVRLRGTTRARDFFLDSSFRRASGDASQGRVRADV